MNPLKPNEGTGLKSRQCLEWLLALALLLLTSVAASTPITAPAGDFLDSKLVLRPGIDDLNGMTVRRYMATLEGIPLNDGTRSKVLGWSRSNNRYSVRVNTAGQALVLHFMHDLSPDSAGRFTLLETVEVDGEVVEPLAFTMLILAAKQSPEARPKTPLERLASAPEGGEFAPLTPAELSKLAELSMTDGLEQLVRPETVEMLGLGPKGEDLRMHFMTLTQDQKHLFSFGALLSGDGFLIGLIIPDGAAFYRVDRSCRLVAAIWRGNGESAVMMEMPEASRTLPRTFPYFRHALKVPVKVVSP